MSKYKVALVYEKNLNRNFLCLLPIGCNQVEISNEVECKKEINVINGQVLDIQVLTEDSFNFLMQCLNIKSVCDMPLVVKVIKREEIDWRNNNAERGKT